MYAEMAGDSEKRDQMISIRLTASESARLDAVIELVLKRGAYIKKADVLREILGVVDTGLITTSDRHLLLSPRKRRPE
ncbi:MAG: hypothetical protein ACREDR_28920 [Blastocatellia bacterium]